MLALFAEIVRDVWKDRKALVLQQQNLLAERCEDLQRRKDRVVDAFLHEGKLDEATYQEQLARFTSEIDAVRAQIISNSVENLDVDGALEFAERFLTNPDGCWDQLSPGRRLAFQDAVYPGGLRYKDDVLGTGECSPIFKYLGEIEAGKHGVASPTGLEPVSPA